MKPQRLTKRAVDAIQSTDSEFTAWDDTVSGFGVRVRPTGAKSYVVVYRAGSGRGAVVALSTKQYRTVLFQECALRYSSTRAGEIDRADHDGTMRYVSSSRRLVQFLGFVKTGRAFVKLMTSLITHGLLDYELNEVLNIRKRLGDSGMAQHTIRSTRLSVLATLAFLLGIFATVAARADENGVSFWLPGLYGSLAATPQQPGWSFAAIYYHASVSAGGSIAAAREVTLGGSPTTLNLNLNANVDANLDFAILTPSYVFATPVLGGQFALGLMTVVGHNSTSLDGTLTAGIGGINFTRSGSIDSSLGGFGDLYPSASLRWNMGVHNFMTYVAGDIPVGAYDPNRLANLGIGHGAVDGGFGYTYFDPQSGHELSAVTGFTYNFENPDTNYRNGVDWHLDWGASQFLSKQLFIGAVGYFYQQISADSGQAAFLGSNESRVIGVGPQIGYLFPIGDKQGYLNLKGYYEFDSYRRPDGWNLWLTFAISPTASTQSPPRTAMFHK